MRTHTKIIARMLVLAAAGWLAGCNHPLEDGTNVVMEVMDITIPPVTATNVGGCLLTVTQGSANLANKMKNSLAGASDYPYNDIVLQTLHVDYVWDDGIGVPAGDFLLNGTLEAGKTKGITFNFVNLNDLAVGRDGHSANMSMTIKGTTVAGEPVSVVTGAAMNINSCPPTP